METLSKHWLAISILVFVATLAGLLTAQHAKQAASRPAAQPITKAKPLIRVIPEPNAKLNRMLGLLVNFKMEGNKFHDIIEDIIPDVYKLNVVVNWAALEMTRADIKDVPINVNLKNVSLRNALDAVLVLAGAGEIEMDFIEKGNAIYIDTVENLNLRMTVRIYDCSNLFYMPFPSGNKSQLTPVTEIPKDCSSTYTLDISENEENLCTDPPAPGTNAFYQTMLSELIQESIDKDSWWANGGTANMNFAGTSLIVTQTRTNHRRILALLENLRKMQKFKQERQPVTVRAWWVSGDSKEWSDLQSKLKKESSSKLTAEMLTTAAPDTLAVGRGFNRQPILLTNGNTQLLITGVDPVVSDNVAVSTPVTQKIFFGKMLRITATLRNENKEAMVDIDSLASRLRQVAQKPFKDSNGNFAIDNPIYSAGELKTQTVIPVGKPLLIGGFAAKPQGNAAPKTPAEPLMLFIQIDVP